jgi:hypothetical protein
LFLLSSPLLSPIIQIVRDVVVGFENGDGIVPSSLETGKVGTVSNFVAVFSPVLVMFFCRSAR